MEPETLLLTGGLGLTFAVLASVCDRALEPCMEELSDRFRLPHDVACATFLALGSSAPEIFISCMAVARMSQDAVDVSMGTIFGSALLAFTLIPALCTYFSPNSHLKLEVVPLLRDSCFYVVGLGLLMSFSQDGEVSLGESFALLVLFVAYLGSMLALAPLYHHEDTSHHFILPNGGGDDVEHVPPRKASIGASSSAAQSYGTALGEDEHEAAATAPPPPLPISSPSSSEIAWSSFLLLFPPYNLKTEEDIKSNLVAILTSAIITIALLSEVCIALTTRLADRMGMSHHALGLILVATGAQIPDAFASIAVCKQGEGPSSIANAIGSQVVNILVGVGLPFFLSALVRGHAVPIAHFHSGNSSALAVIAVVVVFLALCGVGWKRTDFGLRLGHALVLVVLYLVVAVRVVQVR